MKFSLALGALFATSVAAFAPSTVAPKTSALSACVGFVPFYNVVISCRWNMYFHGGIRVTFTNWPMAQFIEAL